MHLCGNFLMLKLRIAEEKFAFLMSDVIMKHFNPGRGLNFKDNRTSLSLASYSNYVG